MGGNGVGSDRGDKNYGFWWRRLLRFSRDFWGLRFLFGVFPFLGGCFLLCCDDRGKWSQFAGHYFWLVICLISPFLHQFSSDVFVRHNYAQFSRSSSRPSYFRFFIFLSYSYRMYSRRGFGV